VTEPLIALRGIGKRFPGVVAVRDAGLAVEAGTLHAIVGENGAGKSTLMRILAGMLRPDAGEIRLRGEQVRWRSPADAIAAGIGMVHQHLQLADDLTVLENVVLGAEPVRRGALDRRAAAAAIAELGERHGLPLDPDARVEELPLGARQRVEILKVLYRGARILILDEPTAVLVPQEAAELLGNLRTLCASGFTVLLISHRLDEVLDAADAVTVMRHGRVVTTLRPDETDARGLAALMVGGALPEPARHTVAPRSEVALAVRGLRVPRSPGGAALHDVSMTVRAGEIVGLAGVEGNGQTELLDAIVGLVVPDEGTVEIGGRDVTRAGVRGRRSAGLAFIPADRQREGLLLDASLWENRLLGQLQGGSSVVRGPWIDRGEARRSTAAIVAEAHVRTPGIEVAASALSGGNQQRLIVGRELAGSPRVLVAAHPTRGVDVGAQAAIWARLAAARDAGLAVMLLSADLGELIGLCDRIAVMLRGAIVAELDPRTLTPETLGAAMTGLAEGPA
jgi:simple sugar transport system ATP-binding protein